VVSVIALGIESPLGETDVGQTRGGQLPGHAMASGKDAHICYGGVIFETAAPAHAPALRGSGHRGGGAC
jgi:N6-L-threonylcarbamoyladenine synthase